jgi:hypothetical protein
MNSKTLKGRIERIELERSPRHIDRWSFTSGKASQRKTPWLVPACGGLSSSRPSRARPPRNGSDAAPRLEQNPDGTSELANADRWQSRIGYASKPMTGGCRVLLPVAMTAVHHKRNRLVTSAQTAE